MATSANHDLTALIAASADIAVIPEVGLLADALRERYAGATLGILAYGSCLRGVDPNETLVDLYVLVSDYRAAFGSRFEAAANRLLPPNVYYLELSEGDRTLRSKYAVVSLDQFVAKVSPATSNPYFWARFAQPCAVVFTRDETARSRIHQALAAAARTAHVNGRRLAGAQADWRTLWTTLLTATYGTELRPESSSRAAAIVAEGRHHFERISNCLDAEAATPDARPPKTAWAWRRTAGKALSVGRLIKAGFTFRGGADYIAWKIARHSGVTIEVTPWQRRHPILAALMMAPRLYRKGGFR